MKKLVAILFILCLCFSTFAFAEVIGDKVLVNGYYTKSGKWVAPYYRTLPNKTKDDNWSTKGNINPFTNKKGYVKPSLQKQIDVYREK